MAGRGSVLFVCQRVSLRVMPMLSIFLPHKRGPLFLSPMHPSTHETLLLIIPPSPALSPRLPAQLLQQPPDHLLPLDLTSVRVLLPTLHQLRRHLNRVLLLDPDHLRLDLG